ncbi:MAG: hydrogenase maturation protease [Sporichthyaceae bacterium]
MTARMLVAGVGNIFLSDDAFGVEVVSRLAPAPRPPGVDLLDVGIRGIHLAYQLLDGYDTLVLVDTAARGQRPGTLTLLEVDQGQIEAEFQEVGRAEIATGQAPMLDAHGLEPGALLRMLGSLGGAVGKVLVVACEPESLAEGIGLSPVVAAAVEPAVALVGEVMNSFASTLIAEEVSR